MARNPGKNRKLLRRQRGLVRQYQPIDESRSTQIDEKTWRIVTYHSPTETDRIMVCNLCGAAIIDYDSHKRWHGEIEARYRRIWEFIHERHL